MSTTGGTLEEAINRQKNRFKGMGIVRIFSPGMPIEWHRISRYLSGMAVVASFRPSPGSVLSGRHDAELIEWFESAPVGQDIYWSYWHEPEPDIAEGKFSARTYRKAWRHITELAECTDHERLYATLILTGWTADPESHRNWRIYYPGTEYIDVLGWDAYNGAGRAEPMPTYPDPAEVYSDVIGISQQVGKPFGIAETGSQLAPWDASGHQRAEWLGRVGRYLDSHGALFAIYWDSKAVGDFRLNDFPSREAWEALTQE